MTSVTRNHAVLVCSLALTAITSAAHAAPGIDRVPEEFATIQDAIDHGSSRVILVAPGQYAGALVSRSVALLCRGPGPCSITSGESPFADANAGFVLEQAASRSSIRGFDFVDLDLGVFASCKSVGSAPRDVVIAGNTFVNNAQAITMVGGCDNAGSWRIQHNRFQDLRSDISGCGGGIGVWLVDAARVSVIDNVFRGTIAAPPCAGEFTTAGVYFSGISAAIIARNDFELGDGGHPFKLDIALMPEDGANRDIALVANDASGSAAPFQGVNFFSVDNFDVRATCNVATISLQHAGGDGVSQVLTQDGCGFSTFHAWLQRARVARHHGWR